MTEPTPEEPSTPAVSGTPASVSVGRDALVVLVAFLLLGVVCGVVWKVVVHPAEFTKLPTGGSMGEQALGREFGPDAWYVVIGLVAGLLAGIVLTWWRGRDALLTSVLILLGSVFAAAVMAGIGHLLGPGSPPAALRAAAVGARVPERLDVDTFAVFLAWPVAAMLGTLFALLSRSPDTATSPRAASDSPSED